jgi:crotonobetainyl-CoA:carnitine CoA-transferase CaiB-like acyl-CoA transferase
MNTRLLGGLRILDFTWVLAGPLATRILSDFGAEVIKIQSHKGSPGPGGNLTGSFNTWNRNKRSISLDMQAPEAREIFLKLVQVSDVVIENFSPRVMDNWGLGFEELHRVNSRIIMASISGFGHTGPLKDFVAFAPTVQAYSGFTGLTSFEQAHPFGTGFPYADIVSALYATLMILASLESREQTGQGEYIDLSEFEALCTTLGPALLDVAVNQTEFIPQGNRADYIPAAPYGVYRCQGSDRWCVIAVFREKEWVSFREVLGQPHWMGDEKFSTLEGRQKNMSDLDEQIEKWTSEFSPDHIVDLLQKAGIPAGVVQNAEDLAKDPQLRARSFWVTVEHPVLGPTISDRVPWKCPENFADSWRPAPSLGEGNDYVFRQLLGMEERELSLYRERGIIG